MFLRIIYDISNTIVFISSSLILFVAYKYYVTLNTLFPSALPLGFLGAIAISIAFSWIRYDEYSPALKIFVRGLAALIGAYAAMAFPGYPSVQTDFGGWKDWIVIGGWLSAIASAIAAMWRPSFLLSCGFYLWWSKHVAGYITGLIYHTTLDIDPLIEISAFVSVALFLLAMLCHPRLRVIKSKEFHHIRSVLVERRHLLGDTIVFVAIAMQLANYFSSGLSKASLNGGILYWPLVNDIANIFSVAVTNGQLFWQDIPGAVSAFSTVFEFVKRPISISIFVFELLAIIAFQSRKLLAFLFLFYGLMHLGIFINFGANFWQWFVLNLVILAVSARLDDRFFTMRGAVGSAILILVFTFIRPPFWSAWLGWYDTPAVNSTFFVAEDAEGRRTRVPSTYFGFYSYPIAHMSFGHPPGHYLPVLTNGGTRDYQTVVKATSCTFDTAEMASPYAKLWSHNNIPAFIKAYHQYVLANLDKSGWIDFDIYPHHFWSRPEISRQFHQLDKRAIVAYVLRVESLCLSRDTNGSSSRLVAENEYRIDVR